MTTVIVGVFAVSLCRCVTDTPQLLSRAQQSLETSGGASGEGTGTTGGSAGTTGGSVSPGGSVGSAGSTVVTASSAAVVPISKAARLSELKIDPPSTDGNNEYIELTGEPATILQGYWLVVVEGDVESNLGQVDKVVDLSNCDGSPCTFGNNGLLLLVAASGAVLSGDPNTSVAIASGLVRGGLENGTGYIGLFSGIAAPTAGSDWDTDDNGVLELPLGAIQHDALTWTDGDQGDGLYAISQVGPKPLAQATWRCEPSLSTSAWRYGLLLGDSTSIAPDLVHFVPSNLSAAMLTPGTSNSCLEPSVSAANDPGTNVSMGGSSTAGTPTACGGQNNGGAPSLIIQTNGGSAVVGSSPVVTAGTGGAGNACGTNGAIVVEGGVMTKGGESGWWSPSPFADTAGAAGAVQENEGGVAGANVTDDTKPRSISVPGGCTVVFASSSEGTGRRLWVFGLAGFLLYRRWPGKWRNKTTTA